MNLKFSRDGNQISRYLHELEQIFSTTSDKNEAHKAAEPVVRSMTKDLDLFRQVLRLNISQPQFFNRGHYPCPSLTVGRSTLFELVCNCWIPLPCSSSDISTKALHHHADMLLTTGTVFGPGYEHWMLKYNGVLDKDSELFAMSLIDSSVHGLHDVCFVDKGVVHVPLYPPSLTITYALWSHSKPSRLIDKVKGNANIAPRLHRLKLFLRRHGLFEMVSGGYPDYLDFYPVEGGFRGVRRREEVEFKRGPVRDHIQSIMYIVQATGYSDLVDEIGYALEVDYTLSVEDRDFARRLLVRLRSGELIEGCLTPKIHYGIPKCNFKRQQILASLSI